MRTLRKNSLSSLNLTAIKDCLFLSVIVFLSVIPYVFQLGFYSDDWSFLATFDLAEDKSFQGIIQSADAPHLRMRPIQIYYLAGLYWLFHLNPLGYHLVNTVMLLLNTVLFYIVLSKLKQPRYWILTIPLLYILLPNFSTNRFWYAAFQTTLSLVLYLLSLYLDLEALSLKSWKIWLFKILSVTSLLISVLAYEVTLPLFLLNPLILWYQCHQLYGSKITFSKKVNLILLSTIQLLGIAVAFLFKLKTTVRASTPANLTGYMLNVIKLILDPNYSDESYGLNLKQSITVNYVSSGLALPFNALKLIIQYPYLDVIIIGILLSTITFFYLNKLIPEKELQLHENSYYLCRLLLGFLIFFWGYSIFLISYSVQFTTTGIGNRTAFAAAAGVAISLVSAIAWFSSLFGKTSSSQKHFFCIVLTVFCASGYMVNNILGKLWVTAYQEEVVVLSDIRSAFPSFPPNTTLLLDGMCPYIGPAIVFESSWDIASALRLLYRDNSLQGDVVKPSLEIREDGLYTFLYNQEQKKSYDNLVVYNVAQKQSFPIKNSRAARDYFRNPQSNFNPKNCPLSHDGIGVKLF